MKFKLSSFGDILKAMGLVFGDIGTSPIYTLTVIFAVMKPTHENVFGIISLVFWTLIILVTIEYWWLAMSLSLKGEGGIIVLKEIVVNFLKKGRKVRFVTFIGFFGISLLMGDGVITPAISILSAVEGIPLIPGLSGMSHEIIILITIIITILLFVVQSRGTDKIASSFGPIMLIWFIVLFLSGFFSLITSPQILLALNPWLGLKFIFSNGIAGFIVLSEVILCATGGEALYADMGHLGAKPIRSAWIFVFIALVVNYLGQGVFSEQNPDVPLVLFGMIRHQAPVLYIPFIFLALFATIIASQAMISAVFSLVFQGITTRIFPLMKIKYTSSSLKSQIYIGAVNWGLMVAVILMIILFGSSAKLAAAYGVAVTVTMTLSSFFLIWIFGHQKRWVHISAAILVFIVDTMFCLALMSKIPHGGYWSIVISLLPFMTTMLWVEGQRKISKAIRSLPRDVYEESYLQIYNTGKRISGTALFFSRNLEEIPPYMVHVTLRSNILYDHNILVSVIRTDTPYDISSEYVPDLCTGLSGLIINAGYLEILDIPAVLKKHDISEKVIFYGVEDIVTDYVGLKAYAFMKKLTPNFVQFYKLPITKIHGVVTRIEI